MKALLVTVNGEVKETDIQSLEEMQAAVGGYIQLINLDIRANAYVNEDGRAKNLPINKLGTLLCKKLNARQLIVGGILGNMVIVGPENDGEDTDIPKDVLEEVNGFVKWWRDEFGGQA